MQLNIISMCGAKTQEKRFTKHAALLHSPAILAKKTPNIIIQLLGLFSYLF